MSDPTLISVSDFIGVHDDELYPLNLQHRIVELEIDISAAKTLGEEPAADDMAEHEQLIEFWERIQQLTAADPEQATIVPDDLFPDWAREEAEQDYGLPPHLSDFVDWSRYAQFMQSDFRPTHFGTDLVWVR
jgi:hypothetical protein